MHFTKWTLVRNLTISMATFAMLLGAGLAASTMPVNVTNGILTGSNGMTLYIFDKDVANSGKSGCNGPCASNWPALMASETDQPSGDLAIITRDDGRKQWAMKGKPLYFWSKDSKPGDKTGDGFNNVWHAATP